MYRAFTVRNFRGFREVNLQDFSRVNLIAGQNNVGKTALLEALFLHCGAYNPALTVHLNGFRGIESLKLEFGKWAETPWICSFMDSIPQPASN
jgi:AAA15 family ATPase/GTPase